MGIAAIATIAWPMMAAVPPADHVEDRRIIADGETAWGASFVTGDASVSEMLVADDFSGLDSRGSVYDKAMLIDDLRRGPHLSASTAQVESIRFFGETAIVRGRDLIVGPSPQGEHYASLWTDIWVRRAGRWQIVAAQDMRIAIATDDKRESSPAKP